MIVFGVDFGAGSLWRGGEANEGMHVRGRGGALEAILARSSITLRIMSPWKQVWVERGKRCPSSQTLRGFRGRSRGNLSRITSSGHPGGLKNQPSCGRSSFQIVSQRDSSSPEKCIKVNIMIFNSSRTAGKNWMS